MQKHPNLTIEKKLWQRGYKRIIGIDEVGRGSLAGNVTVAGVLFPLGLKINESRWRRFSERIKDSKQLTPKRREEVFEILKEFPEIEWRAAHISEKVIDRINIRRATERAMVRVIKKFNPFPDFVIFDGIRFSARVLDTVDNLFLVKADVKVMSCALASIIAKVTRDRYMRRTAKKYPRYGFERHKGYGTLAHRNAIRKYGVCVLHRRSFRLAR